VRTRNHNADRPAVKPAESMEASHDPAAFIRANTRLHAVPHVPEIALHVANEYVPLWERTEEELQQIGLPPPFWAFAWAGGQALARYILDNPALVAGLKVLDFASGSGLVAIAAAKAGAASVVAADIDVFALVAIEINAAANAVAVERTGANLLAGEKTIAGDYDVVLAGDIFYERGTAERAFNFLIARAANGARVLIGDPGRTYLPKERLVRLVEYRIPVTRQLEDSDTKKTAVWRLAD
jgi:predicted nicotinamide N-methyase